MKKLDIMIPREHLGRVNDTLRTRIELVVM